MMMVEILECFFFFFFRTNEYTQGFLEHVTVLIGLSIKEEAIGGK